MPRSLIIAFILCLLIAIGVLGLGLFAPAPPRTVTIYAHDPTTFTPMAPIHVWRDLNNRSAGFVGYITDGMSVRLLRRVGDGVLIELPDGKQGWVNATFIAELH